MLQHGEDATRTKNGDTCKGNPSGAKGNVFQVTLLTKVRSRPVKQTFKEKTIHHLVERLLTWACKYPLTKYERDVPKTQIESSRAKGISV